MRVGNYDIFKSADTETVKIAYYLTCLGIFTAVDKNVASACVNKLTVSLSYVNKMNGGFSVSYIIINGFGQSCPFVKLLPGRNEIKVTYRLIQINYRRKNNCNNTDYGYYRFPVSPSS